MLALCFVGTLLGTAQGADSLWVTYPGHAGGVGSGKKVVLISGDDEYRSEEGLPQLGKILSVRHGFDCTVLFPIDPDTGEIKPDHQTNIPGTEALIDADLVIMLLRFRNLPPEQMKPIVDYVESGRPIIGLRTATHAFNIGGDSPYARYSWQNGDWKGGFGRQVLGETWISHHGHHGKESTLGILAKDAADHPVLCGLEDGDIWGPTDVYGVRLPLPGDSKPLVLGQVLSGMSSDTPPVEGHKNDPMMPVAWVKSYTGTSGKTSRVFCTTMGASQDLSSAGLRRLILNASLWGLELEDKIKPDLNVDIVGDYAPIAFGFGKYAKGVKPSAYELSSSDK
ncbi:MAG: ThuA domain-containing protein [Planctomycetaceae bacterium]|nr:ThuA domain-containing protein [Planctomycetaceae bacterium]MCB9950153.1 ThuA domain-containing protein [Planctomycetaceae bacterium]